MEYGAGFLIAISIALTGIGGGGITVPLLLLDGIPATEAVGTAMVFSGVIRFLTSPWYLFRRQIHPGYLGLLLAGAVPGLLLGSWALRMEHGAFTRPAVMLGVGAVLTISSLLYLIGRLRPARLAKMNSRWLVALGLPIGLQTGFSATGSGALTAMVLLSLSEMPVAQVVGTETVLGLILGFLGSTFHLLWRSVDQSILMRMLAGGIPGAIVGCALTKLVPGAAVRAVVAVVVLGFALELIWTASRSLLHL